MLLTLHFIAALNQVPVCQILIMHCKRFASKLATLPFCRCFAQMSSHSPSFAPDVFEMIQSGHKLVQPDNASGDFQDLLSMAKQELTDEHLKCAKYINRIAMQSHITLKRNMLTSLPKSSLFKSQAENSIAGLFCQEKQNHHPSIEKEFKAPENEHMYWSLLMQYALYYESTGQMERLLNATENEIIKHMQDFGVLQKRPNGKSFAINKKAFIGIHKIWATKNNAFRKKKMRPRLPTPENPSRPALSNKCLKFLGSGRLNKITNNRLVTAKRFGQPLVFDMRFKQGTVSKPRHVAEQIGMGQAYNRMMPNPFHLVFCNVNASTPVIHGISCSAVDPELISTSTEKSYLDMDDLLPREKLVYLSPDANQTMETFSHEKIYIIGGLVDSKYQKNLTKAVAGSERIHCEKLPLKLYLNWGGITGREGLSLDVMFKILASLKNTNGNWIEALKHVPGRFHRGLSEYGMQCVNYDEETLLQFAKGKFWHEKRNVIDHTLGHSQRSVTSMYLGR